MMRIALLCAVLLGLCSSQASVVTTKALSAFVLVAQTPTAPATTTPSPAATDTPAKANDAPKPAEPPASEKAATAPDGDALPDEGHRAEEEQTVNTIRETQTAIARKFEDEIANDVLSIFGVENEFRSFMSQTIMGFSVSQIVWSFVILMLTLIFRGLVTNIIFKYLHKLTKKTKFRHDEVLITALEKPVSLLLLWIGFFLAILVLPLNSSLEAVVDDLFRGTSMIIVIWALVRVIDVMADILNDIAQSRDSALHGFVPIMRKSSKAFIIVIGVLMVIDNLGYNVSGILATLGLGGAALAFASKDTIGNLFGTLMIMLDRPFKVGDWIIVGNQVDGDVESIGLRSTKVRTWPKTVMSIPNGVLANEYINNWSRMPKRRVKQYVGISYEASADDMEGIVADIKELLKNDEGVQQEFILVNFTDFGESSLDILVYYFTKTTAWVPHMEVRERVNCNIMRAVRARGLSIAFPARSLYMEGPIASKLADVEYKSRWEGQGEKDSSEQIPGDFGPSTPP
ncbi:mechanosensitive ion channel family protein [Rubellicoccus peritrichatus]|uniref:Mechanosensitive ion channel n=1 Tax=Rubellicoccus peritrichatus TaxID=3080537 RepID=A0AAQ3LBV1_9BACT|nr:mechanosensitive ion channel domain-containing protein [Puniceicoccus sp. CR14]WOO43229.1 mechanosensitive ion channel [Puniceicoccus sp. CR14]